MKRKTLTDQQKDRNSPSPDNAIPRIISYNIDEGERPGGIKVRYKIRVVSGPRAKALDNAQAQVLKEVLQWSLARRQQQA